MKNNLKDLRVTDCRNKEEEFSRDPVDLAPMSTMTKILIAKLITLLKNNKLSYKISRI